MGGENREIISETCIYLFLLGEGARKDRGGRITETHVFDPISNGLCMWWHDGAILRERESTNVARMRKRGQEYYVVDQAAGRRRERDKIGHMFLIKDSSDHLIPNIKPSWPHFPSAWPSLSSNHASGNWPRSSGSIHVCRLYWDIISKRNGCLFLLDSSVLDSNMFQRSINKTFHRICITVHIAKH